MLQSQPNIQMQAIFNLIYPVGSLYFSTSLSTKEQVQNAFGGTWEKLPEGYAIWTASSGAGNTIAAGLPNIIGSTSGFAVGAQFDSTPPTGVFTGSSKISTGVNTWGSSNANRVQIKFNASHSNSVYGKSTTVQPPAYKVYVYRRTALSGGGGLGLLLLALCLLLKGGKLYVSK